MVVKLFNGCGQRLNGGVKKSRVIGHFHSSVIFLIGRFFTSQQLIYALRVDDKSCKGPPWVMLGDHPRRCLWRFACRCRWVSTLVAGSLANSSLKLETLREARNTLWMCLCGVSRRCSRVARVPVWSCWSDPIWSSAAFSRAIHCFGFCLTYFFKK